jgi:mRNA-degrading endonuclease RelE of RelBE toxin-antitoxin system
MEFIETSIFTRQVLELLDDASYQALQVTLITRPDASTLIRGSGGLRKIRWGGSGRGKRGGVRVIYYWVTENDQIYMIYMYPKSSRETLTKAQLNLLRKLLKD